MGIIGRPLWGVLVGVVAAIFFRRAWRERRESEDGQRRLSRLYREGLLRNDYDEEHSFI